MSGNQTKTDLIVECLIKLGKATSYQVAEIIGESERRVTFTLNRCRKSQRYGVLVAGSEERTIKGRPLNLWAVDIDAYHAYCATRRYKKTKPAPKTDGKRGRPPLAVKRKRSSRSKRVPPKIPVTSAKTCWVGGNPFERQQA